ncbi:MAG: lipoprotein signal peptidase [Rickettsiaceae bacterium]|nr:MAG: lipoprotein signal peptidase [Rickettsiaceae bacterium]
MLLFFKTCGLTIPLLVFDQIAKWWIINHFSNHLDDTIRINHYLEIVLAWNPGISFGYFGNFNQYSNLILALINSTIVIYLLFMLAKAKSPIVAVGYSFVTGGAVGNIVDRLIRNAVCDFLHFHYNKISFPIFNLADSFIFIGSSLLLYGYYHEKKIIAK